MTGPRRVDRGQLLEPGSQENDQSRRGRGRPAARTRVKLPPDPYGEQTAPRRPVRYRALIVLASAGLLILAAAVVNHRQQTSGSSPAAGSPAANTAGATAPGVTANAATGAVANATAVPTTIPYDADGLPESTADRIPVGYPDTSAGAESAAANYVSACWSAPMVYSSARANLVNAIADPAIATEMQEQLNASFTAIQGTYGLSPSGAAPAGLTFVERTIPVGVSLVQREGGTATVAVWVVTMSGLAGSGSTHPVTEGWSTVTVSLNWTHGDWKWFKFTQADGPTPLGGQQTPSTTQALQSAINQFGGLSYAR
jgi:hypothetical protein